MSSIAGIYARRFHQGLARDGFCYVSLRDRIKKASVLVDRWGGDDLIYHFSDGSKLIERRIVREFKLFKG